MRAISFSENSNSRSTYNHVILVPEDTIVAIFTSNVCSESQGGALLTGIRFPLYMTAGATNLMGPARGCYNFLVKRMTPICEKIPGLQRWNPLQQLGDVQKSVRCC